MLFSIGNTIIQPTYGAGIIVSLLTYPKLLKFQKLKVRT